MEISDEKKEWLKKQNTETRRRIEKDFFNYFLNFYQPNSQSMQYQFYNALDRYVGALMLVESLWDSIGPVEDSPIAYYTP